MKRIGNIFQEIASLENLIAADGKAQKGKSKQYGVITHNKKREENIENLQKMLVEKTYRTSKYDVFKVYEPKEREVFRLPYFPDRICHHAILNVLEPIFVSVFTSDSYSCIKGKGIHAASYNLRKSLRKIEETEYCLNVS